MKRRTPSTKPRRETKAQKVRLKVEGFSAGSEYLKHCQHRIEQIVISQDRWTKIKEMIQTLAPDFSIDKLHKSAESGVVDFFVSHQVRDEIWLEAELDHSSPALIVALDHVTDPRNVGAVVRTCSFFGVSLLLVPERRQALLSDVVANTAQGALASTELVVVKNLGRSLESLKERGFWALGADSEGEEVSSIAGFYDKTLLVLGAEDKGLSVGVRQKCDKLISIPSRSNTSVESLNVSVAAGILIYALS